MRGLVLFVILFAGLVVFGPRPCLSQVPPDTTRVPAPVADTSLARLVPVWRLSPGGVRIRSIHDNRRVVILLPPAHAIRRPAVFDTIYVPSAATQRDLEQLEARLIAHLDRRLLESKEAQLASVGSLLSSPGGILVFPPGDTERNILLLPSPARQVPSGLAVTPDTTAADTLAADTLDMAAALFEPDTTALPAPEPVALRITASGADTILVERQILETGLFRAVNIVFEVGRAALLPPSVSTLNSLAYVLVKYPDLRLEIAGHSDSSGPDEYNLRLSQIRAEAVRAYLTENLPIAPGRLVARGYGESKPIASNDTATGRGLNRRVEFAVLQPNAELEEGRSPEKPERP